MVDWLTWPAELLLSAGGIIASWFVSKDAPSFPAIQMGFGLLVLAAVVSLFAFLPTLVRYWRSRSRINRPCYSQRSGLTEIKDTDRRGGNYFRWTFGM